MPAAADYDLTGQILWPAAALLAEYIAAHPDLVVGRRGACELGAGLGLVGFTALQARRPLHNISDRRQGVVRGLKLG